MRVYSSVYESTMQSASVTVRVSGLGGSSTDIPGLSRSATIGEVKNAYVQEQGAGAFDLSTRERVLEESELLSDVLTETAETGDTL
jgi:hypothetical protein